MAIVIQTLSRSNNIISSQFIHAKTAIIGRGYSCDLHVNDPYVCEQHLKVTVNEQNQIEVEDVESVNGLKINDKLSQKATVSQNDVIVIGQSRFKIFVADEAIAPTKKLNPLDQYLERIAQKRLLLVCVAMFVLLSMLQQYVNTSSELDVGKFLTSLLSAILVICIVPLGLSLLSMINKKEPRLITQFNITFIGFIAFMLLGFITSFVGFNFNQPAVVGMFETLIKWLFIVSGFWLLMYVAFHQSNVKRNTIVFSVIAVFVSLQHLPSFLDDNDFISAPNVKADIMSPSLLFTSSINTELFVQDTHTLFESASQVEDDD